MKTKKLSKKLELNKKTIAHLNNSSMKALRGGVYTGYTCQDDGCDTVISCENTMCWICESIRGCPDPPETNNCSGAANSCGATCGPCITEWGYTCVTC